MYKIKKKLKKKIQQHNEELIKHFNLVFYLVLEKTEFSMQLFSRQPNRELRERESVCFFIPGSVELDESIAILTDLLVEVVLGEHNDVVRYHRRGKEEY